MTTNHPDLLDPALLRKGRVDRDFCIDYASKTTAELTFKRLFGLDACRRHTPEAIDRFANAFKDQFPTHSRMLTATLAQYCGQYRGRPCEAVRDFAEYLSIGDDKFAYNINRQSDGDGIQYNVPEPFDETKLIVSSEDFCRTEASAPAHVTNTLVVKEKPSSWNVFGWGGGKSVDEAPASEDTAQTKHRPLWTFLLAMSRMHTTRLYLVLVKKVWFGSSW